MKKLVTVAVLVLTAATANAFVNGVTTNGITGTPHDIPGKYGAGVVGTTQKCVFCHTPHNPRIAVPLWNRNAGTAIGPVYNSPSLTSAGKGAGVSTNSISGFCMSCHDGTTAIGNIKNTGTPTAGPLAWTGTIASTSSANLTTNLTNSHPVGFSYNAAYNEDVAAASGARLIDPTVVATKMGQANPPFFNKPGTTSSDQMECASCHKVHDDRIAPFLRYTNGGSALCLACHNK